MRYINICQKNIGALLAVSLDSIGDDHILRLALLGNAWTEVWVSNDM